MDIVTGYKGTPHITAAQERAANMGSYGLGEYILDVGSLLEATAINANTIQIADGAFSLQGCVGVIATGTTDSVTIQNGSQGMNRIDLIVVRYTRNAGTGVENMSLAVITGTPTSSTPTAPAYTQGDISAGDTTVEAPLYSVRLTGVNVAVTAVADVVPSQDDLGTRVSALEDINNPLIKRVLYSASFSVAAGGTQDLTANNFSISTPAGYTVLCAYSYSQSASRYIIPYWLTPQNTGTSVVVKLYNAGPSTYSGTFNLRIAYIRSSLIS